MKMYICTICGYSQEGASAPEKCPQCNAPASKFTQQSNEGLAYADEHRIGVVTNTIPNTGVNLPFISYGGTSLLVSMALVGVLLNISRYSVQRK